MSFSWRPDLGDALSLTENCSTFFFLYKKPTQNSKGNHQAAESEKEMVINELTGRTSSTARKLQMR